MPKTTNWRRGLLRLWLCISAVWFVYIGPRIYYFFTTAQDLYCTSIAFDGVLIDYALCDPFLDSDCYKPDNPVITHFLRRRFDKVLISFPDGTSDAEMEAVAKDYLASGQRDRRLRLAQYFFLVAIGPPFSGLIFGRLSGWVVRGFGTS